jgi:UDP-N-acetylglucosamine 1-carboxyvinyltransferase
MKKVITIEGGRCLHGTIEVGGSKNSALPCLAASILTGESIHLRNIPLISDVESMLDILRFLNVEVSMQPTQKVVTVNASAPLHEIPARLSKLMRGSTLLLGSLLARCGKVVLQEFGGCPLGKRPINLHLNAFRLMGAKVQETATCVRISARRLRGVRIPLDFPSVGATENSIISACLAEGKTTITNAAVEPEILDLVDLLKSMGAGIEVRTDERRIEIEGRKELGGARHQIIPDRIEAGTYAVAAGITRGDVVVDGIRGEHLQSVMRKLIEMGLHLEISGNRRLRVLSKEGDLNPIQLATGTYPGFPTDMQPQFTSLATEARGTSLILETIYENRYHHVSELNKMGARISVTGRKATIEGPTPLHGTQVRTKDIRGGAALILAALSAEGVTTITSSEIIERGYENLEGKLVKLGAKVRTNEHVS